MNAFLDAAASVHYCSRPIRLAGGSHTVDTRTGTVLSSYSSTSSPLGVTVLPCGNRRASVCPACSRTYARDTFELIRAGAVGGKTVPTSVADNPMLFVTLTAPSFGHVHRTAKPGEPPTRCRPRTTHGAVSVCEHGRPVGCMAVHEQGDYRSGQPICPECYDYEGHVIWQWWAPELWRRFTIDLRRSLARALGVTDARLKDRATVQYAKVGEYQTRGVIHFHALIRLDGPTLSRSTPGGVPDGFGPAPQSVPVQLLADLIERAAAGVQYDAPPATGDGVARRLRFGQQLDVRIVRDSTRPDVDSLDNAGGGLRSEHVERVAGYLAKYSTKSATDAAPDSHTGSGASKNQHLRQVRRTCLRLADLARDRDATARATALAASPSLTRDGDPYRLIGKWAHMLGFRGHFATKSRRYSVTLGRLRRARRRWQTITADANRAGVAVDVADLEARLMADDEDETTLVIGDWSYIGSGWPSNGDAALANAAAARAREYHQWRADQSRQTNNWLARER